MTLYLLHKDAVCPVCAGTVKQTSSHINYKCNDCDRIFTFTGFGQTDREIEVAEVSFKED